MSQNRIETELIRELNGFSFTMRIVESARTVRVFVADEALEDDEPDVESMRSEFEMRRSALEAIAREKYANGRVTSDGVIIISLADILGFFE
jgi:hypothetical protein